MAEAQLRFSSRIHPLAAGNSKVLWPAKALP